MMVYTRISGCREGFLLGKTGTQPTRQMTPHQSSSEDAQKGVLVHTQHAHRGAQPQSFTATVATLLSGDFSTAIGGPMVLENTSPRH